MTKKFINHAIEIANEDSQHIKPRCIPGRDGKYYTPGLYRMVCTAEPVPGLPVEERPWTLNTIERYTKMFYDDPYRAVELPAIETLKDEVRELVGRKHDRVVYRYDKTTPAVNVRFLIKAMEALKAKRIYVCSNYHQIFVFENDDLNRNYVMIMPIKPKDENKVGMWIMPEERG